VAEKRNRTLYGGAEPVSIAGRKARRDGWRAGCRYRRVWGRVPTLRRPAVAGFAPDQM